MSEKYTENEINEINEINEEAEKETKAAVVSAIDGIAPQAGAKERIYQSILKKSEAEKAEKAVKKKKAAYFMRYALPIAACICLVIVGTARLNLGKTPVVTDEGMLATVPFTAVESADDFAEIGIELDAPEGAEDIFYSIIDGKIASVTFTYEEKSYEVRASEQSGDFSGIVTEGSEISDGESIDAKSGAVLYKITSGDDEYTLIAWSDGRVNYRLFGVIPSEKVGGDEIAEVYRLIAS